ncbi:MAG: hypothetical protein K0U98_15520 [Deltaproteobacteria bacterium]|nr:hypothetical protein [Deltaproteobacteria bacterium]
MNSDLYFRTDAAGMTVVEVSDELQDLLGRNSTDQVEGSAPGAANLQLDDHGRIQVEEVDAFLMHGTGDTLCDCPEKS